MNPFQNNDENDNVIIKGSCVFNLRIISFVVVNLIYFSIMVKNEEPFDYKLVAFVLFYDSIYFMLSAASLFFFVFSNKMLVVKNCWYFWYRKEIEINSIKKIKIESVLKVGAGVRIIANNRKYFFACSFIKDKDLAFFAKRFIEKGIEVEIDITSIREKLN